MSIFNTVTGGGSSGKKVEVTDIVGTSVISVDTSFTSLSEIESIYVLRKSGAAGNNTAFLFYFDIDASLTRQKGYSYTFPANTTLIQVPTGTSNYTVSISNGKLNVGIGASSTITFRIIVIGK